MNTLEQTNIKYWELLFSHNELGHKSNRDYSARCPVCGDSKKKKGLKRCHLFTKPTWDHDKIHCFNCGWSGNMFSLLELVSPSLYNSYKNEKRSDSFDSLKPVEKKETPTVKINTDFFDNTRVLPPKLFNLPSEFKDIINGDDFYKYLKSRKISDSTISLFKKCEGSIVYNDQPIDLSGYIILPLWCGSKIYGFQARSINHKQFYTFIPEENSGYKVWNWFDVDVTKDVYIFESYFDAMSSGLSNIIAQLGATLSDDRLNETKKPVFVLDNQRIDPTAREESLKYVRRGYRVMVWPNKNIKYKDFNEILKNGGTLEQISKFILNNIDDGITAELSLMM